MILLSAVTHVVVDRVSANDARLLDYVPAVIACIATFSAYFTLKATRQTKQIADGALLPALHVIVDEGMLNIDLVVTNASKSLAADAGQQHLQP
jgi:hypothetical protein